MPDHSVALPRIVIAGAVESTQRTLLGLLRNGAKVVGVLGLNPKAATNVSCYCRLDGIALTENIPYAHFTHINDSCVVNKVRQWQPDILFAVGLSQILKPELLAIPKLGSIGFHPTRLPVGRGRAPIAWLTLEGRQGAATFFQMEEGVDSGPILVQEPFAVSEHDYAEDVNAKALKALDVALDRWIPRLLSGEWQPRNQAPDAVVEYGRRSPSDGLIDWEHSANRIYAQIRAASRPHPGAYTYAGDRRLIVWRAQPDTSMRYRGVVGRIVAIDESNGALVQTGKDLLWLTEVEGAQLKVGMRLGYSLQDEINALRNRVAKLEQKLREAEGVL